VNTAETKLRPAAWFNTQTRQAVYGIEICIRRKWIPIGDKKGFFLFDTKEARDAAMATHQAELNH